MKRSPFAEANGVFYVKVKYSGIHFFCVMADAMSVTMFGKTAYLKVDDAIRWHQQEVDDTGGSWRSDYLEALKKAKQRFMEETNGQDATR